MGNWCGRRSHRLYEQPKQQETSAISTQYEFNFEAMVQFKTTPITLDYRIQQQKGKGASAEVYRAVSIGGGFQTAIKKIRRRANNDKLASEFMNEFTILRKLDHPNVLKVYDIYEEPENFYIVTELCTGGELFDQIMIRKTFTELSASLLFYQVLEAVRYLHENKIMHRDIKPENLLLSNSSPNACLKLIDFGSAVVFEDSEPTPRRRVGTSYYVAPEVLQRLYNEKVDIWSCGVILYILLSGEPPFKGKDDKEVLASIERGQYSFDKENWKYISAQAKDLISKMLEIDPKKRLTVKDAMMHPWFEIRSKSTYLAATPTDLRNCLANMKNFCVKQCRTQSLKKIQEGVLMFIVNFLTSSEEKERLMLCFKALDLDGDGTISREELKKGFAKYMQTTQQETNETVDKIFAVIDKNHSKAIDYSEFVMACIKIESCLTEEKIGRAFRLLDRDCSGTITSQQLRTMLGENIPLQQYQQFVREFDLNGDGQISRVEFFGMMKKISFQGY